jgi:hypothetical protein
MTEKVNLVTKTISRIILWFFLFLFIFELFGIALIFSGLPGLYLFLNPHILVIAAGLMSFSSSLFFAIIDLNKN